MPRRHATVEPTLFTRQTPPHNAAGIQPQRAGDGVRRPKCLHDSFCWTHSLIPIAVTASVMIHHHRQNKRTCAIPLDLAKTDAIIT